MKQYNMYNYEIRKLLEEISNITKIFGVELFHYDHNHADVKKLKAICDSFINKNSVRILYTAGSDCHGTNKENQIGIPYNYSLSKNDKELYKNISNTIIEYLEKEGMQND